MNDATGMPQSAVLLGGTSEIGLAILDELAQRRLDRVVLAGRDAGSLEAARSQLLQAGVSEVTAVTCDVTSAADVSALVRRSEEAMGDVDLLLVAAGDLGTAEIEELVPERVLNMFATNAGGPAAAMLEFARAMTARGCGRIVVLSSVAGLRVRRANFVYGAGKAALDGLSLALADALAGSGVTITIVRPGFVRTRMTAGRSEAPFSTDAAIVARAVATALERGDQVVYVPRILGPVSTVLRVLPRAVFRRLPG
ncbi:MAG: SDR family NAD(P)-dependent oxidoreductase [Acidimicrobiales bacterium]